MKKIYPKLIAMGILLSLSVSVVAMASYAWMVLASSPVVSGIQVAIGGGNTILVAPDISETVNGQIYHYPGRFSEKLNFRQYSQYDYLQQIGSLMPVSTYNGIDWFLPAYYTSNDEEVASGDAMSGQLKPFSEFKVDSELSYANLNAGNAEEKEKIQEGHYAYLDFWVVSPSADFTLRISTDKEDSGGTFVIDLLQPEKTSVVTEEGTQTGYTLKYPRGTAATTVRVGFLANPYQLTDDTMQLYTQSITFDERVTSLRGLYAEPNSGTSYFADDKFVIYEPNGNSHPHNDDLDGTYVETQAIGYDENGQAAERTFLGQDRLTVQNSSLWSDNGQALEERFQTALLSFDVTNLTTDEIAARFYNQYLQGQIYPYIDKAQFYTDTDTLYAFRDDLSNYNVGLGNVTKDVAIIDLQRNVPQRIRMFIWLEGQDVDCVDMASKCSFAVNIELAGGNE